MAEKIYLLDTPEGPMTPVRRESRQNAPAWQEAPVRRDAGTRTEPRPRAERTPRESVVSMGTRTTRSETPHMPQLGEELVPEAWIKAPQPPAPVSGRRPFKSVGALIALYGLGGIAPLALRVGPRQFVWAALSIVALTTWVTLAWFWTPVRAMMTSGRLPILPCLVGLVLVHALGSLAWSRAVARTVRDDRFQPEGLPRNLRHPWVAGILGLLMPGAGLAMARRSRTAALALWNGTMVTFAVLVLVNAGLLWTWNVKSGVDQMPPEFIEAVFLGATGIAVLGGLVWITAALDGARLATSNRRSGRMRARSRSAVRSDRLALALVVSLVLFAVTLHPGRLARDLDSFAGSMRWSGFKLIPLAMESGAAALDPGLPQYAMRVAELHAEMGHPEKAQAIHDRLRQRWEAYAQQLLQTAASGRSIQPATPLQPAHDLVPRTTDLGPSMASEAGASNAAQ